MFKRLHRWLIKLVVGGKPVIMNIHFPNGYSIGQEHAGRVMIDNCWIHGLKPQWESGRVLFGEDWWTKWDWEPGRVPFVQRLMTDGTETNEVGKRVDHDL